MISLLQNYVWFVTNINIDAKDTCGFHTPEDWTGDVAEDQETDSTNMEYSEEEDDDKESPQNGIQERQYMGDKIHSLHSVYDEEQNGQNVRKEENRYDMKNMEQLPNGALPGVFNKAWRQPYGGENLNMYQGNRIKNLAENLEPANAHQRMAQQIAKQKGRQRKIILIFIKPLNLMIELKEELQMRIN